MFFLIVINMQIKIIIIRSYIIILYYSIKNIQIQNATNDNVHNTKSKGSDENNSAVYTFPSLVSKS